MFIIEHQNAVVLSALAVLLIYRSNSAFLWVVSLYYLACSMVDVYMNGFHRVGVVFSDSVLEHYTMFSIVDFMIVMACSLLYLATKKRAYWLYGALVAVYFAADFGQFVMEWLWLGHKTIKWHSNLQSIQILLDSLIIYMWARDENLVSMRPRLPFDS